MASKASTQNVQRSISSQKGPCLTSALLPLPVKSRALCTNIQSTYSRVSSIRNFSSLRKTPPSRLRTVQELLLRHPPVRLLTGKNGHHEGQTSVLVYICAVGVFMIGMTYAGVPLYRIFCQVLYKWYCLQAFNLCCFSHSHDSAKIISFNICVVIYQ